MEGGCSSAVDEDQYEAFVEGGEQWQAGDDLEYEAFVEGGCSRSGDEVQHEAFVEGREQWLDGDDLMYEAFVEFESATEAPGQVVGKKARRRQRARDQVVLQLAVVVSEEVLALRLTDRGHREDRTIAKAIGMGRKLMLSEVEVRVVVLWCFGRFDD